MWLSLTIWWSQSLTIIDIIIMILVIMMIIVMTILLAPCCTCKQMESCLTYIYIYIHTYDNYTQILSRTCILDCCTSGKVFLGPPGHLNIPSPIYRTIHLNIRMELMFHTTSGALWSGPPSTYLNVFKCRYSTHTHNIYIYMYKRRRNHNFG